MDPNGNQYFILSLNSQMANHLVLNGYTTTNNNNNKNKNKKKYNNNNSNKFSASQKYDET